jgi:L-ascorbate metabolism protein UlaG (beta-lactamase superfamily)
MNLQLIRSATIRLEYAGVTILIDPMLGAKHSYPSYTGIEDNPTVGLPIPASEVLVGVDVLLISHLHTDHFDKHAQEIIDKELPILCQPGDKETVETYGFNNVVELENETQWQRIHISRTGGQHGTGR